MISAYKSTCAAGHASNTGTGSVLCNAIALALQSERLHKANNGKPSLMAAQPLRFILVNHWRMTRHFWQ